MSLLRKFQFNDGSHELEKAESQTDALAGEEQHNLSTREKDALRCVMMELASSFVKGAKEDLVYLIYTFAKDTLQNDDEMAISEAYHTLSRILEEHDWFCSSRFAELIDLLLGLRSPVDIISLRSSFASFQSLMIHTLKIDSEVENSKLFLILNEIILKLKDAKDEAVREAAYDVLLKISVSLRDPSCVSSDGAYEKLINMIMGYLTSASPHIKSGAVPVLSVLVYKDTDICLSMPDLLPSILSLLQGKALEVIKSRHNKKSSKEVATTDIDTGHVSTSTYRTEDKKRKRFGKPHEKNGLMEHREMKRVKKHIPDNHRTNELRTSSGDGFKRTCKGRQYDRVKSNKDPSERSGKTNKEKYSKGPASGFKRKMDSTNTRKDAAASPRPCTSSKSLEHKKVGRKH